MTTFFIVIAATVLALAIFALAAGGVLPFRGPFRKKAAPYMVERVEDLPDDVEPLKLYVVGSEPNLWAAAMMCPCGCKERIELNLLKAARPCWDVAVHQDGTASLSPSVWRQKGCESHFFLRNGFIRWC